MPPQRVGHNPETRNNECTREWAEKEVGHRRSRHTSKSGSQCMHWQQQQQPPQQQQEEPSPRCRPHALVRTFCTSTRRQRRQRLQTSTRGTRKCPRRITRATGHTAFLVSSGRRAGPKWLSQCPAATWRVAATATGGLSNLREVGDCGRNAPTIPAVVPAFAMGTSPSRSSLQLLESWRALAGCARSRLVSARSRASCAISTRSVETLARVRPSSLTPTHNYTSVGWGHVPLRRFVHILLRARESHSLQLRAECPIGHEGSLLRG